MGMIDIHDYHWATRLEQLKYWFRKEDKPLWLDIETALSPMPDLISLLIYDSWRSWDTSFLPPPMAVSIQAWWFLLKQPKHLTQTTLPTLPIQVIESIVPFLYTKPLQLNNLNIIQDFFSNAKPKTWEHPREEFHLPMDTHFACLRILHFLSKHPLPTIYIPPWGLEISLFPYSPTKRYLPFLQPTAWQKLTPKDHSLTKMGIWPEQVLPSKTVGNSPLVDTQIFEMQ